MVFLKNAFTEPEAKHSSYKKTYKYLIERPWPVASKKENLLIHRLTQRPVAM